MKELVEYLIQNKITISSAESFTVGHFASEIGSYPGVSAVFKGGFITYQTEIKEKVLGVDPQVIAKNGVVSVEVAKQMAILCKQKMDSQIAVSFTGNAGPNAMENKPVGLCYIGICIDNQCEILECRFEGNRRDIVNQAVCTAVEVLKTKLHLRRI